MSGVLMLYGFIINLFSYTTRQNINSVKNDFSKINDDKIYLYQGSIQDCFWNNKIADTRKILRTHHFIERIKLRKYIGSLLSIIIDEADLHQLINYIRKLND